MNQCDNFSIFNNPNILTIRKELVSVLSVVRILFNAEGIVRMSLYRCTGGICQSDDITMCVEQIIVPAITDEVQSAQIKA